MKSRNKITAIVGVLALVIGLVLGKVMFHNSGDSTENEQVSHQDEEEWTCSMHPQIRRVEPSLCPICGMDLVPVNQNGLSDNNPLITLMSPTAMQLAGVQVAKVESSMPNREIRLNGKVQIDERLVVSQSAHIPGRIEKLHIAFQGEEVKRGQVIGEIYSPELVIAQEELFQAIESKKEQPGLYASARQRLMNWKLSENEVDDIEKGGKVKQTFAIRSEVDGIVLKKRVNLGDYTKRGQVWFEIADLSSLWINFDVYERDLAWLKIGDRIEYSFASLPGQKFNGKISFVDPRIDARSRVAKARVELVNANGVLKPDMFSQGIVKSEIGTGMEAILVPKSAVLWTGTRSIVYVKAESDEGVAFTMRKVELGSSSGTDYIVLEGLEIGEEIAVHGAFSIDAAAQLAGKPSMMNPYGGKVQMGHQHGKNSIDKEVAAVEVKSYRIDVNIKSELEELVGLYMGAKNELVKDDYKKALALLLEFETKLGKINMSKFNGDAHLAWMEILKSSQSSLSQVKQSATIGDLRKRFKPLSNQVINLVKTFGPFENVYFVQFCPMADEDSGAHWLSSSKEIRNPYFGSQMLKCGEVIKELK
jgi:membrane fusion protein, copper/silver efflux system